MPVICIPPCILSVDILTEVGQRVRAGYERIPDVERKKKDIAKKLTQFIARSGSSGDEDGNGVGTNSYVSPVPNGAMVNDKGISTMAFLCTMCSRTIR
jgi:hypothetical protein